MSRRTVLRHANVFDGTGAPAAITDIAFEGERIVAVGSELPGDDEVDLAGSSVIPGLFDAHVHVLGVEPAIVDRLNQPFSFQFYRALANLDGLLSCGVTTVRDCAGADLGLKQALAEGIVSGPRLQIAITALSQTGGHMDGWTPSSHWVDPFYVPHPGRPASVADGVTGVRKAVRRTLRAGADFVKVLATHSGFADYSGTRFSRSELTAIRDEARAAGVPVAVHAYGADAVKDAVAMGARSVEHVASLDDEAIEAMVTAGVWLVPTVARLLPFLEPEKFGGSGWQAIGHQVTPGRDRKRLAEQAFDSLYRAHAAGVRIAMGTDFGNRCGENLLELEAMRRAGIPSHDVLRAATSSAATLMNVDGDLGTIEAGKLADFVVLDGSDPFDFVDMKSRIRAVYQGGRAVYGAGVADPVASAPGRPATA